MSFNDLMTVLLTFFILLVSTSNVNVDKVRSLSDSAVKSFGTTGAEDKRESLVREVSSVDGIKAHRVANGVSIVLSEPLLYRSGSADITNKELLTQLGKKIKAAGGSIRVEGHTDSIPIENGFFSSNWELSAQRAVNAVKFLAGECGIDPRRLSAAGYADSVPLATNDTVDGRALNRRVNIVISFQ